MPYCFAPGCNHVSRRETCSFFRFPSDTKLFKKWRNVCRRKDRDPNKEDRLCSCHFENGDKDNLPSIFAHFKEVHTFPSPPKQKRKKKAKLDLDNDQTEVNVSEALESKEIEAQNQLMPGSSLNHWEKVTTLINESEIYNLRKENESLKELLTRGEKRLSFQSLKSDVQVFQYTGLPNAAHFNVLLDVIQRFEIKYFMGWKVKDLNIEDQLLCTLMKLRLDLQFFDLAFRFKISHTAVHNIFVTFVHVLHEILFVGMMKEIPSREKNKFYIPTCFIGFPNIRIILDCTEVEIAIPSSLKEKKYVFSHYKQRHTFKVLIGIAPNATITYVSDMYPGSTSDKAITRDSGVLSHMRAGDLILCDKGFLIADLCTPLGVNVNIPPFLSTGQFSKEEVLTTRKIARSRIHVERAISRLKSFRVLDFITPNMKIHGSIIIQTCAALVNMQYSLLKENEQCFHDVTDFN